MAKSEQPANPVEQPQLSDRQWEVLRRVVKGESVAPEKGKRIDLTLNSLVTHGFIQKVVALGKPTVYRALAAGLKALEIHSKPAEPKAPDAEKKAVPGAGGPLPASVFEPGVPSVKKEKPEKPQPEKPQPEKPQPEKPQPEKKEVEESETQVARYVPRKGDIVWNLDGDGVPKKTYYRVVEVGVLEAKLEKWSGASWKPVPERQEFESLKPLTEAELAKAIKDGIPLV